MSDDAASIHESGHGLLAIALGFKVRRVQLDPKPAEASNVPSASLIKLQARCSHRAGETFHRHGALRAMVWVTEDADGVSEFETGCSAPADVSDAVALETLCDEIRADFAHDGVTAYAVAFVGPVTFIGIGLAILAHPPTERRRVVIVEAHNAHNGLVATREIIVGAWPRLGPLQRHTQATGRFRGLLTARAMEPS